MHVQKMTEEDFVGLSYAQHALHVLFALDERETAQKEHVVRSIDRVVVYIERLLTRLACDSFESNRFESLKVGSPVEGVSHAAIRIRAIR